jgi:hypothetical protein
MPIFGIKPLTNDKKKYTPNDNIRIKLMNNFIYNISRSMAGCITDKRWFLMTGMRNCGKGVICDYLSNSFEKYIITTNAGNFIYKENRGDEAKANSWIIGCRYCRLCLTNEIAVNNTKNDGFIDGNKIKLFSSGGDSFQVRANYQDEFELKIQCTFMACANDIPNIKPRDCLETCSEYKMSSKFVSEEKLLNTTNQLNNVDYFMTDPSIKSDFIKRQNVKNELVMILFEYYCNGEKAEDKIYEYPSEVIAENDILDDDSKMDDITLLKESFLIDSTNFISNEELKHHINQTLHMNISLGKAKSLLKGIYPLLKLSVKENHIRGISGIKTI